MQEQPVLDYICELAGDEILVQATNASEAAQKAAEAHARKTGARGTFTLTVSEANDYGLPLIAGDDFTVTVDEPG